MTYTKPTVILSFQKKGQNSGPYQSHLRIMNSNLKEKYNFVPLYLPRFRELIKPKVFRSLVRQIEDLNADLFHFTGLQLDGYVSYRLGNAAGVPTVCAIRGSTDEATKVNPLLRMIIKYFERKTLEGVSACYAVSEYVSMWEKTQKYANNMYGCIYNFYDFSPMENREKNRIRIRNDLKINLNDIVIVSTGRIVEEKGYGTVNELINIGKPWGNVKFIIAGDGKYRKIFENNVKLNGMQDNVFFLGYRNDIGSVLDASDIYLSCSWHETFGNSIIEACYHRLPVVASRVGGIPEIINDEISGYLIKYDDVNAFVEKIKLLVSNKALRKKLGERGFKYVTNKFNPLSIENKLDGLYQSVLERGE